MVDPEKLLRQKLARERDYKMKKLNKLRYILPAIYLEILVCVTWLLPMIIPWFRECSGSGIMCLVSNGWTIALIASIPGFAAILAIPKLFFLFNSTTGLIVIACFSVLIYYLIGLVIERIAERIKKRTRL